MKDQITFDLTDANTIADSDKVIAFLRDTVSGNNMSINGSNELLVKDTDVETAVNTVNTTLGNGIDVNLQDGAGTDITSTGGALDVNIASASGLGVFAEDSAHTSGDDGQHILAVRQDTLASSVSADGDYGSLKLDALGQLYVTANISNTNIEVTQGTSPWVIGDGGGSITVDAVQLDIDDLNATDDAVAAWTHDGTGNAIGSTTGSLNVHIANASDIDADDALANTALKNVAETVGTSAAAIVDGADELASRKHLWLYNNGNRKVYFGESGITTATGFPISPKAYVETRIGDAVDVFMISGGAGQDVRTLQMS